MISEVLQDLVDRRLTSVKELAELTGRGESTIYRWLARQSQPNFEDMRTLAQKLSDENARRRLIDLFTSGLPVIVEWMTPAPLPQPDNGSSPGSSAASIEVAMDKSLAALDNLSEVLVRQQRMIQQGGVTHESAGTTLPLINDTIRHLTASRNILMEQLPPPTRAKQRPASVEM